MGQTLSSETFSISGGDGYRYWVGLTMKPSDVGCKKTVYKGVLLGRGPRQWEKVVAKAFTDIPGTKTNWNNELNKADVTKQLAAKFEHEYLSLNSIRIVIPGIVQMDRVSNINKWLAAKNDGRGLIQDEWISVEELIPGKMGRYCPWSTKHAKDHVESSYMQAFSHFTYKYTNGELVACDFQGIYNAESSQYIFTDSSIHSIFKLYGLFDQGEYGISEFFKLHKCNEICNGWPKPTPLTPPPSFAAACAIQNNLTPASAYENIIFPTPNSESMAQGHSGIVSDRDATERRRHCSERLRPRQAEHLWIGHSVDFDDFQRHQTGRTEYQVMTRGRGADLSNHPPPSYENLSASLRASSSQPPPYHSIVNAGGTSNSLARVLLTRRNLYEGQSGSLNQLNSVGEGSNVGSFGFRPRSATDPLLHNESSDDWNRSGAYGATCIPNFQTEDQTSSTERKSNPVFYFDEPPVIVPSAPPEEG